MADTVYNLTAHEAVSPTFALTGSFTLSALGDTSLATISLQRETAGEWINVGDVRVGDAQPGYEIAAAQFRLVAIAPAHQGQAIALKGIISTP